MWCVFLESAECSTRVLKKWVPAGAARQQPLVLLRGSVMPCGSTFPTVAAFGCTWKNFWQLVGCVWSECIKYEFEQA